MRGRTGFGRKGCLVAKQAADPSHDVVNVLRRRQLDLLAILVDPCIIQPGACAHRRVVADRAKLGDDPVELVEIVEEVEYLWKLGQWLVERAGDNSRLTATHSR